ncbi:amidohydrolase [marine bacterium AO1-C]|nr:amidohydrolase [marine bacterium AO1-C]
MKKKLLKKAFLGLLICLTSVGVIAQKRKGTKKWDVAKPGEPSKTVTFTVKEGTWMNLDVSPDGKEIVFDMLGDIYKMPIAGGKATLLRGGYPFEVQPRFSPDGKQICFTSDAGGGDNIWIMDKDGKNARQITKETFRLLNNAVWTPDGQYLIARKHFTGTRSLGAGEIWMYHISGGKGLQLVKRRNQQKDINEPWVSPDGRYVYFSQDVTGGSFFQYNKNPNGQIIAIQRFDRQKGKTEFMLGGPGSAMRPQLSRDGKMLAFVRRVRTKTVLYVHNLETGEQRPVFDGLSKDQQEAWTIFGLYTNFNWLPDNQHIVIYGQGKIWKVNIKTAKATEIPFEVTAKHTISQVVRFQQQVSPEKFKAKVIRQAITSPDQKSLIFNAVGYLWKRSLPKGKPQRLTKTSDFEFEPSFSPNGREIVYVTWNDEKSGAIHKMNLSSGKTTKLTTEKGIYRTPKFSPDGSKIIFRREGGNNAQGFTFTKRPGLYWMSANGGKMNFITREGENPTFNKTGDRVFYNTGGYLFGSLSKTFKSVDMNGQNPQVHFTSKYANQFSVSPDNEWIAFGELHKVYVASFPKSGKPINLTANTKVMPVALLSKDAGINLHWSKDSKKVFWTLGNQYFTRAIADKFTFLPGGAKKPVPADSVGLDINLELKTDVPTGVIAFKNARIITMKDNEVIENGTIIVEKNKIKEIGKADAVKIPAGAEVIDAQGKTIMPGFIDAHAHLGTFRYGLSPQKQWSYFANLAYGVTTTHDPSSNSEMVFTQSEMVKGGQMVGPRIYSTGTILYGADGDFKAVINNYKDAESAMKRTQSYGAFSVKSYNQPRRNQRQQVIKAARKLKMMVCPEGGSFFNHNLSMILDGHTTVEHNLPVARLYDDVVQMWKNAGTAYTPTLIVCYGANSGEYYFYQKTNVWEKKKLLKYTPRGIIDARSRRRMMVPDEEYENGHMLVAKSCKKLEDAGVLVNLGAHGQLQGLGVHWELWLLHQGGMSNLQALRCATINPAKTLGLDKEVGTLEKGKLADLIVLDKNPLENIRNTESVRYTMVNGRLFDTETMNEIGNRKKARSKFYWELNNYNDNFQWHENTQSFQNTKCHCGRH